MSMPGCVCVNVYHNKIAKGCKVNYAKQNLSFAITFHFETQAHAHRVKWHREREDVKKMERV